MPETTRMPPPFARLAEGLPTTRHPAHVRQRLEMMEKLLEGMFVVPGTRQRIGLDALLGILPVGGDAVAAALGLYIVWEARNLDMPRRKLARMVGNVAFDFVIGLIPVIGDTADFFFRSNTLNLKMIKRHLDRHHPATVTLDQ